MSNVMYALGVAAGRTGRARSRQSQRARLLCHRSGATPGVAHVGGVVDGRAADVPLDMAAAVGREELDLGGGASAAGLDGGVSQAGAGQQQQQQQQQRRQRRQ